MVERSLSLPSRVPMDAGWSGNPFYSVRTQQECALQASRPVDLPMDDSMERDPLQNSFGIAGQPHQSSMMPTGKGRGMRATDGPLPPMPSVENGHGEMWTEGKLPAEMLGVQSMGPVGTVKETSRGSGQGEQVDDL